MVWALMAGVKVGYKTKLNTMGMFFVYLLLPEYLRTFAKYCDP